MKNIKIIVLILAAILSSSLFAQYPHSFEFLDRNEEYGRALDVVVSSESTIFAAYGLGGLRAYTFDGTGYVNSAYINNGETAYQVALDSENRVYLANGEAGLFVYEYDGSSFNLIANADFGDGIRNVTIGADDTVFIVGIGAGLNAYELEESEFSLTAYFYLGHSAEGIEIRDDNTIFIATWSDDYDLRAFTYTGSSFINTANLEGYNFGCSVGIYNDVVFLANLLGYITAYHFEDDSFTYITDIATDQVHYDLIIGPENKLFCGHDAGISVYDFGDDVFIHVSEFEGSEVIKLTYDIEGFIYSACRTSGLEIIYFEENEFTPMYSINDVGMAFNTVADSEGYIFLANGFGGLSVYNFSENIFSRMASIGEGGGYWYGTMDVAVGQNGSVFTVTEDDGLRAYEFDGDTLINTAFTEMGFGDCAIAVQPDGTIIYSSEYNGLCALEYTGNSFEIIASYNENVFATDIHVLDDGYILSVNQYGNLCLYSFDETGFEYHGNAYLPGEVYGIAVRDDGIIFAASGDEGLWACDLIETLFSPLTSIYEGGSEGFAHKVAIGSDGTIFLANGNDGVRAYSYDDLSFTTLAHYDDIGEAKSITFEDNNTIFVSKGNIGLFAYAYHLYSNSHNENIQNPTESIHLSNYPNPFNPETRINYSLTHAGKAELVIYNVKGKKVQCLDNLPGTIGMHSVIWNASKLSSGIYLCQLKLDDKVLSTKKAMLMK